MRLALLQLRAVFMAFAALLLGLVVVAAPANAGGPSVPEGFYLCHATGNPSSVEAVENWRKISPSSSGALNGHVGHQNGTDIIPPIPGLTPGQNWTAYGQQVHAAGCAVPQPPQPPQPEAETRSVPRHESSCALGGVTSWVDVYSTPYVWDDAQQSWVVGTETGPERTDETFVAYSDAEYFELCASAEPAPVVRTVPKKDRSCDPAGVTSWDDVYTTKYVWDAGQRTWVPGQETGPVRANETFTPYTDEDYLYYCSDEQPAAEHREVPRSEASCELGGVTTWTDVYTTEYVWDAVEREWVLGEEAGPVRTGETFVPYTDAELAEHCGDVAGEDDENDPGTDAPGTDTPDTDDPDTDGPDPDSTPDTTAPSSAAVPTVVNAGLGVENAPSTQGRQPLWLLVLGGGLVLMGSAGIRRRASANR